jgi:carboxylesterase type B
MKIATLLAVTLTTLTINSAFAKMGPKRQKFRVNKRQFAQKMRIKHGIKNGSLTRREATRLVKAQKRIKKVEALTKKDGKVTKREARLLERMQDKQSKKIYGQKHDEQTKQNNKKKKLKNKLEDKREKFVVNKRQENQKNRITHGIENGSLTKFEAKRLVKAQKRIAKIEKQILKDGKVTDKEAKLLKKLQDLQSKLIYKQKHDGQNRNNNEVAMTETTVTE